MSAPSWWWTVSVRCLQAHRARLVWRRETRDSLSRVIALASRITRVPQARPVCRRGARDFLLSVCCPRVPTHFGLFTQIIAISYRVFVALTSILILVFHSTDRSLFFVVTRVEVAALLGVGTCSVSGCCVCMFHVFLPLVSSERSSQDHSVTTLSVRITLWCEFSHGAWGMRVSLPPLVPLPWGLGKLVSLSLVRVRTLGQV